MGITRNRVLVRLHRARQKLIEGRLAVLYSPANYWNALSNPESKDLMRLRFATNAVVYALTHGNISDYSGYKPAW